MSNLEIIFIENDEDTFEKGRFIIVRRGEQLIMAIETPRAPEGDIVAGTEYESEIDNIKGGGFIVIKESVVLVGGAMKRFGRYEAGISPMATAEFMDILTQRFNRQACDFLDAFLRRR